MLQARFDIVHGLTRLITEKIGVIMRAYVILHNIIVEDEQDNYGLTFDYDIVKGTTSESIVNYDHHSCYETCFQRSKEIRDSNTCRLQLYKWPCEVIWKRNSRQWHK